MATTGNETEVGPCPIMITWPPGLVAWNKQKYKYLCAALEYMHVNETMISCGKPSSPSVLKYAKYSKEKKDPLHMAFF